MNSVYPHRISVPLVRRVVFYLLFVWISPQSSSQETTSQGQLTASISGRTSSATKLASAQTVLQSYGFHLHWQLSLCGRVRVTLSFVRAI